MPATAAHGKQGKIYGNGRSLADTLKEFSTEWERSTSDSTALSKSGREHTVGTDEGTFSGSGFVTASVADVSDLLRESLGTTDNVLLHVPLGDAIGEPLLGMIVSHTKGAWPQVTEETVACTIEGKSQNGVALGHCLQSLAALTTSTDGASLDNGAATANGGEAFIHVSAITGTDAEFIVEHSTDDAVWATLATFTAQAAAGGERVVVAEGTAVNRYLRVALTGGTYTSVTALAGFARN